MWLCIMHHIHLFTLSGSSPLVALPYLGTPPGTQPHFSGWAEDSLAWLTQPGKPLKRAESDHNKQWWLGGWFVFATRIYQLFTEIKTKLLSQRCLMFWGSVSERINIILLFLLWLQKNNDITHMTKQVVFTLFLRVLWMLFTLPEQCIQILLAVSWEVPV